MLITKLFALLLSLFGFANMSLTSVYPLTTEVTDVNYETNIVTTQDYVGHVWEIEGTEDWTEGAIVDLLLCDNGTPYVDDDFIVYYRCGGYMRDDFLTAGLHPGK